MIARHQTPAEFKKHLQNPDVFTLREAMFALERFYLNSKCQECDDESDSMVFMTGVFDDFPNDMQIVLTRNYEWFSQLTIVMRFARGLRARVTPTSNVVCTGRDESDVFFRATKRSWSYRIYKNLQPNSCSIQYDDRDDKPDSFYERFITAMDPVFAES